jgi:hypothetical protein
MQTVERLLCEIPVMDGLDMNLQDLDILEAIYPWCSELLSAQINLAFACHPEFHQFNSSVLHFFVLRIWLRGLKQDLFSQLQHADGSFPASVTSIWDATSVLKLHASHEVVTDNILDGLSLAQCSCFVFEALLSIWIDIDCLYLHDTSISFADYCTV